MHGHMNVDFTKVYKVVKSIKHVHKIKLKSKRFTLLNTTLTKHTYTSILIKH
jgi:hypothetical protein